MRDAEPPVSRREVPMGLALACAALLALALLTATTTLVLVSTLGVVVVAAGLMLPPRPTLVVAGLALALAVLLAVTQSDGDHPYRVANVAVGCGLGLAASLSREAGMRRVRRAYEQEAALLTTIDDAVVMVDAQGRVLHSNQALQQFAPGVATGDVLHERLVHLRADGSSCGGHCVLAGRLDGRRAEVHGERIGPSGAERPTEYVAARSASGDVVVSLRDSSHRLEAEAAREAMLLAAAEAREHRRVLDQLGSSLVPRVPRLPGVELDVWSRPADVSAPSGGDLVDVSVLPDGRVVMIIVDALGRGVTSVRDAWKVLYVSRSYLAVGLPLQEVVGRTADAFLADSDPPTATLLAATLDPGSGAVSIAGGGHPPPLVLRAEGDAQWLDVPGRGVGTPEAGSDSVVTTTLADGDCLLLYTDGLVEATRDVVAGLLNLRASALALHREPTQGWAQRLVDAVLPAGAAPDDTVVLFARRVQTSTPPRDQVAARTAAGRPS